MLYDPHLDLFLKVAEIGSFSKVVVAADSDAEKASAPDKDRVLRVDGERLRE